MKLQITLEEEVRKYINEINYSIKDKLLWNECGVLFSISKDNNDRKCLFAASLENDKVALKEIYYRIVLER